MRRNIKEVLDEQAIKILLQPGTALTELIVEDEGELVRVIVGESLFRRERGIRAP